MTKRILIVLVLLALSVTAVTGVFAQDEPGTLADELANVEGLETLSLAVGFADPAAVELLNSEGPFTVFAPTDTAFSTMDPQIQSDALSDTALLTSILQYHIAPGQWLAADIVAAIEASEGGSIEVPTLLADDVLTVAMDDDGNVTVNGAIVGSTDNMASNGVIHTVDTVLIPPSMMGPAPSYVMEPEAGSLGSEDDPIVFMFIPSEDSDTVLTGAEDLAGLLTEKTGLTFAPTVSTDYSAAIEAICGGEAEIVALNTFGYVLAHERGCADVGVVSVRFGSSFYNGQVVVGADSGIESYEDLAGTTFCRPDPLSTSGWIIPSIAIQAAGVDLDSLEVIDAGGHDGVITSVYNGDCDAGSTFVDARGNVADELTDVMDRVLVIDVSPNIPNDTLSFSTDVPEDVKANIVSALVEIASDEVTSELLSSVYSWDALAPADDAFFDDFREQLDAAGINIEDLNN